MKTFALFLLAAILPVAARAQDNVRILEVGLQGHYATAVPTPVRVHIPAVAQPQTVHLTFLVNSNFNDQAQGWLRTDRFEKQVTMIAGQPSEMELPILLPNLGGCELQVVETDSQGKAIGGDKVKLPFFGKDIEVAIYCRDNSQCLEAQAQITPSGTNTEDANLRNSLGFVLLKELRKDWLAYRAVDAVVVAGSIGDMPPDQGKALEYYLRSGGILVLLEKEAAAPNFLAAYHQNDVRLDPIRVGEGRFYRVSSLASKELAIVFAPNSKSPKGIAILNHDYSQPAVETPLRNIGASFTFPPLRWLLIWIAAYILIVGVVNFAILRRLRKLEWGWVTVSVTALIFSAGLYLSASSRRPEYFTLDQDIIYSMDGHSPVAFENLGFRISAPVRAAVGLTLEGDALLAGTQFSWGNESAVDIGSEIVGAGRIVPGAVVQLGPPLRMEIPMLRWSFKDFYAEGFHEFPGTLHWTSPTRLKNDTGLTFRNGVYEDFTANSRYAIPLMLPGQEIDLAGITPSNIYHLMKGPAGSAPARGRVEVRPPGNQKHRVEDLFHNRPASGPAAKYFTATVEPAEIGARLDAEGTTGKARAVANIFLDQP
jgi:hypothetical protein